MTIQIEDLRLKGIVGVYEHEQAAPQDIVINVSLSFDAEKAVQNDCIEQAVDYEKLSNDIRALLANNRFQLIETLAQRIADLISVDPRVLDAKVKVSKPAAIESADCVSATARFDRKPRI